MTSSARSGAPSAILVGGHDRRRSRTRRAAGSATSRRIGEARRPVASTRTAVPVSAGGDAREQGGARSQVRAGRACSARASGGDHQAERADDRVIPYSSPRALSTQVGCRRPARTPPATRRCPARVVRPVGDDGARTRPQRFATGLVEHGHGVRWASRPQSKLSQCDQRRTRGPRAREQHPALRDAARAGRRSSPVHAPRAHRDRMSSNGP